MKIQKTKMLNTYLVHLVCRIIIFVMTAALYLIDKEKIWKFVTQPITLGTTPLHVLWAFFMLIMLAHLFPSRKLSMAIRKSHGCEYVEVKNYSELELYRYVQKQNIRAWMVMLVWLLFNSIFGILYLCKILNEADLLMLTVFYFLCDYICILFFCPFQTFIMKNKCCVNCRIYDWGHFMMFTPMLFIKNFFSWSLFVTSCIVLIHWEILYAKHPERFWSGSNKRLQCANCEDKICQLKKAAIAKK